MAQYLPPAEAQDDNQAVLELTAKNAVQRVVNWELADHDNPYVIMNQIQAIYTHAQVYVGSIVSKLRRVHGYNAGQIAPVDITMPEGIIRLLLEVLTNAGDNAGKSRDAGIDPGPVYVKIRTDTITVRNGGLGISLKDFHPQAPGKYNPEVIFGTANSSGNYRGKRKGAGIHGLGVKLANIFSSAFSIDIGNKVEGIRHVQHWRNNMREVDPPIRDMAYVGENYVEVSYSVFFPRFDSNMTGYGPNDIFHFAWLAASLSMTKNLPVYLDYPELSLLPDATGTPQPVFTPKTVLLDYTNRIRQADGTFKEVPLAGVERFAVDTFGARVKQHTAEEQAPVKVKKLFGKVVAAKKASDASEDVVSFSLPSSEGFPYLAEVVLLNTPNQGSFAAFTNGPLPQPDGGEHVNVMYRSFGEPILEEMKRNLEKVKEELKDENSISTRYTIEHVKKHISMVLSVNVTDPDFGGGQSKTKLDSFPVKKVTIPPRVARVISNWSLGKELKSILDHKFSDALRKSDGSRGSDRHVKGKYERANEAGTANALNCTLWVTEGDSGAGYIYSAIDKMPGGRDLNGVFPARGKFINPIRAEPQQLLQNKEYKKMKQILGLIEGLDGPEALRSLNYGKIMVATDADYDGSHIKGLLLNLLYKWPKLVAMGLVGFIRTPQKRLELNGQNMSLYTTTHVEAAKTYVAQLEAQGHKVKAEWRHCKGLGSSNDEEIAIDMQTPYYVLFQVDETAEKTIRLWFDDDKAWIQARKEFMLKHQPTPVPDGPVMSITDFGNTEMAEFSQYNLERSIPNIAGNKPVHTKILYALISKKWKYHAAELTKVAQLKGFVAENTIYHHGEDSISLTIIRMAQDYPGGPNNLPYFSVRGQFGSRTTGGKDHAADRYIEIKPAWWLFKVFRKEDDPILERQEDDGVTIEPKLLLPTIPLIAINSSHGIGTGWSSDIEPHRVPEVIACLRSLIQNGGRLEKGSRLAPWYRGVRDRGQLVSKKNKVLEYIQNTQSGEFLPGLEPATPHGLAGLLQGETHPEQARIDAIAQESLARGEPDTEPGDCYKSFGAFQVVDGKVIITELPANIWIRDYDRFLEDLRSENIITGKRNLSKKNEPHFIVTGMARPSYESLKLVSKIPLSNMNVINENGRAIRFSRIEKVIQAFYFFRRPYYAKRKEYMLRTCDAEIARTSAKLRFIQLVISGQVEVRGVSKTVILPILAQHQIDEKIYESVAVSSLSPEGMAKMAKKLEARQIERGRIEALVPDQVWLAEIEEFAREYAKHYDE